MREDIYVHIHICVYTAAWTRVPDKQQVDVSFAIQQKVVNSDMNDEGLCYKDCKCGSQRSLDHKILVGSTILPAPPFPTKHQWFRVPSNVLAFRSLLFKQGDVQSCAVLIT